MKSRDAGPTVAIIGAGVGGIATAVKLKLAGLTNFEVFEQSDGPGGTWHHNTYPGCEVDIHSSFYSFSFMPWDWSETHASQPELLEYLEKTIDHFDIRDRFHFNAQVSSVTWDEDREQYLLTLADGQTRWASIVVSCVGLFNIPRYPEWPGLDEFQGAAFHTARWQHDVDLAGKKVAVVGTGSTAAQVVPAIAETVGELYQLQREPGWILPKGERVYSDVERAKLTGSKVRRKLLRYRSYREFGAYLQAFDSNSKVHRELTQSALDYINSEIESEEVREAVTPKYPFGCKRIIRASTYYSSLNLPNVHLVPHAVERITSSGVVSADGTEHEIDVLIMATGFQAERFLDNITVTGIGGRDLHKEWGTRMQTFLGITVNGFPNFFMTYGPNTNGGGSIIYQIERQSDAVVVAAKRLRGRGPASIDTRKGAVERYTNWVDKQDAKHYSSQGVSVCHGYFHSASGRNVVGWPLTHRYYSTLTRLLPFVGWRVTKRAGSANAGSGIS